MYTAIKYYIFINSQVLQLKTLHMYRKVRYTKCIYSSAYNM